MAKPTFWNPEFLFGNLEAGRQAAETEAGRLVEHGSRSEDERVVILLDNIVTAIEAFQAEFPEGEQV